MKIAFQIEDFIKKHDVKHKLIKNFEALLKNNREEDLDIDDKNITLNFEKIRYKKTKYDFHSFEFSILKNNNEIGYFALIYDDKVNLIDEFFYISK